jgi:hypothetical protein
MAAPDPFGTIVNAIALAQFLQTTIITLSQAEGDEIVSVSQIKLSAVTLGNFVDMFGGALEAGFRPEDQAIIAGVCELLSPEIERMKGVVGKIQSRDSKWGKAVDKIAWLVFQKQNMESLANQMTRWSASFHQLVASLPSNLRQRLENLREHGTTRAPDDQMKNLSSLFDSLAASAKSTKTELLQRDPKDLDVRKKLGKFRSALYQGNPILVEYKRYDSGENQERLAYMTEQIGRLSNFLALADPLTTGILKCAGWIVEPELYRFGLLFKLPLHYHFSSVGSRGSAHAEGLVTLHSFISAGSPASSNPSKISYLPKCSLDTRVSVACMIAVSVFYLHSYSWVHENLRSSNVVMLTENEGVGVEVENISASTFGRPFLVGFNASRSSGGIYSIGGFATAETQEERFGQDLYCHPDRQGQPNDDIIRYQMCHDLYSLGVILLEIGLWMPLEREKSLTNIRNGTFENSSAKHIAVRGALLKLAKEKLGIALGERYCQIVIDCLSVKSHDSYRLVDFLNRTVTPLWEMKSALS